MSVTVRTNRLRNRLRALDRELPRAAIEGMFDFARTTLNVVQEQARIDWGGDNSQIGFDLGGWIRATDDIESIEGHGIGILNVNRMGTAEDFEKIRGINDPHPGTWHAGTRQNDSFRRLIAERPGLAGEVAAMRQGIWGDKQPQWWLLNYGNAFPGAFDPRPGTFTIEKIAFDVHNDINRIVSAAVNDRLRATGVLV